jgi:hypothetical protein
MKKSPGEFLLSMVMPDCEAKVLRRDSPGD